MPVFVIKENGIEINRISADLDFVQQHFAEYEEVIPPLPTAEESAREWRNAELQKTDWIVPIVDHPKHANYLAYRQALRDWPNTDQFPDTRPQLA